MECFHVPLSLSIEALPVSVRSLEEPQAESLMVLVRGLDLLRKLSDNAVVVVVLHVVLILFDDLCNLTRSVFRVLGVLGLLAVHCGQARVSEMLSSALEINLYYGKFLRKYFAQTELVKGLEGNL